MKTALSIIVSTVMLLPNTALAKGGRTITALRHEAYMDGYQEGMEVAMSTKVICLAMGILIGAIIAATLVHLWHVKKRSRG